MKIYLLGTINFFLLYLLCNQGFSQNKDFVKVQNGSFYVSEKPYYFLGANYWYGSILAIDKNGKERLKIELDFLKESGVDNLRIMAAAEGFGAINGMQRVPVALQKKEGVFDEDFLKSLDFLLDEMGKRKMKAVLFLSNNWEWSGGFLQYLNWNGILPDSIMKRKLSWDENRDYVSQFYSCENCKKEYLVQLKKIIQRKNSINQKKYINDATIMAWELANEPRPMRPRANNAFKEWTKNVSAIIKSLDKNHLVTLGTEGEQGTEDMALYKEIHEDKNVDYLTLHIWPKNWSWFKDTAIAADFENIIAKTDGYITKHVVVAKELNKPLVIEEFGLPRNESSFSLHSSTSFRDKYYGFIFDKWLLSAREKGIIGGVNFWAFGGAGRPVENQIFWKHGDDFTGDPPVEEQGLNSVFINDVSTWKLIKKYTNLLP